MAPLNRNKFILLDRDGTIIVNKHYQKDPSLTELLPNAREGLDMLRAAGFSLAMVTNQSGIARGYFNRTELAAVNKSVIDKLGGSDTYFAGVYYCPHGPEDNCLCRKPRTGLVDAAAEQHGFLPSESYVIGDSKADIELGQALGATTVLVRTGYGSIVEQDRDLHPDYIADDLVDAATWILAREKARA